MIERAKWYNKLYRWFKNAEIICAMIIWSRENFCILFTKGYINIYRYVERRIRKLCTFRYNDRRFPNISKVHTQAHTSTHKHKGVLLSTK